MTSSILGLAGATADVHCYDVSLNKWSRLTPLGEPPSPRAAHVATAVGTMVVIQGHETSNLSTAPAKPSRRFLSSSWAPSWVKEAPDPLFNAALQELRLDVAAPPLICLPSVTPTCVEALRRTAGYGTTFMWLRCCWVVAAAQDGAHRGAVRERAPHPAQRRRVQHHRLRPGRTRLVRELMLLVLPSPPGRGRRPVPRVVVVWFNSALFVQARATGCLIHIQFAGESILWPYYLFSTDDGSSRMVSKPKLDLVEDLSSTYYREAADAGAVGISVY
ncbi:Serine/threonine-protein phosphatase BSL2 [Zea mays]|uniref:Serine/threonine-protein phosphatase BSL2 n=1 Tax=Zea mays TaxID=4577 RepID=A0A317YGK8_MAIZE|nr:Serine/threonine-protein phosphatase BSL2 [Zea mays]